MGFVFSIILFFGKNFRSLGIFTFGRKYLGNISKKFEKARETLVKVKL